MMSITLPLILFYLFQQRWAFWRTTCTSWFAEIGPVFLFSRPGRYVMVVNKGKAFNWNIISHNSIWQVVGVEGHNPSGHCLIATKIVDYIPLTAPHDEYFHGTKIQAMDLDKQPPDSSDISSDLSLVCKIFIQDTKISSFVPSTCEWIDLGCVLPLTDQTGQIKKYLRSKWIICFQHTKVIWRLLNYL